MKVLIERMTDSGKQTIGRLFVLDEDGFSEWDCPTLELPWKENKTSISCIPVGEYQVKKRYSPKFKNHFHVIDVEGRSWILIHKGNYYTDIRGCILVGMDLKEINGDGEMDVVSSVTAMNKLLGMLPDTFELEIINGFGITSN